MNALAWRSSPSGAGSRRVTQRLDPRWFQIAVLASLTIFGLANGRLDTTPFRAVSVVTMALIVQYGCERLAGIGHAGLKSALISGLSLGLLLRADSVWILLLAALVTIASKFVLRVGGKHIFNPTNLGIVVALTVSEATWISPGQWGAEPLFALWVTGFGWLVATRAERADITFAFLTVYLSLIFGRAAWLGDPWSIPLHQVSNGALLIFAFFMISDPRSIPDARAGRILLAIAVALAAYVLRFRFYSPNALILALAGGALLTPLIDRLFPGPRYLWEKTR